MRYMLHIIRPTQDGGEEGSIHEINMTGFETRVEETDHLNLVKNHLVRDGWEEVTFKGGGVTKRFYKEDD